jgi:Gluconate 2-dehydrogenase subunit 3
VTAFAASDVDLLTALANAIIPPDARDAGAAAVDAGPRLAERKRDGPVAALYDQGLRTARELCARQCDRPITALTPSELHELARQVAATEPAFFRQLRLDTTTLYLSDPAVWARIGFPGPSIETGGYPDFDRPQSIGRGALLGAENAQEDRRGLL